MRWARLLSSRRATSPSIRRSRSLVNESLSGTSSFVLLSSLIVVYLVDGQVRFGQFELQQVGASGQEERAGGLRLRARPGFEQMGDVFAGEGAEDQRILEGAAARVLAVDFGESEDFARVYARIEAPCHQALVIGRRLGR